MDNKQPGIGTPLRKTAVVISGRDPAACKIIWSALEGQADLHVTLHAVDPAQADPLHGMPVVADVVVLVLGDNAEETLRGLGSRSGMARAPTIVIGSSSDPHLMRKAMQAGARDFFAPPVPRAELIQAVRSVGRERGAEVAAPAPALGPLIAVINAKGGSGASCIATNLAHMAAAKDKAPVALIDMDLQFGALPLMLDLEPRNSLLEALGVAGQLDRMALQGYMTKHDSGVHVLSAMSDQLPLPWEVATDAVLNLLTVARQSYGRVVVDLPRQIDPLTSTALTQATNVVVVMQQSLAHIRDAKRMLRIITTNLGIARDNVLVVVNRHNERDAVKLADIQETVKAPSLVMLPNDFRAVTESMNSGVPLLQYDDHAPITNALQDLLRRIEGEGAAEPAPSKHRTLRQVLTFRG